MTVWNSLSFGRKALVELPEAFAAGARTLEGQAVAVQKTPEGVKAVVDIPSCGAVSLVPAEVSGNGAVSLVPAEAGACGNGAEAAVSVKEDGSGYVLENSRVKAAVNGRGEVVSFVLKESGREYAAEPMKIGRAHV